MGNDVRMTASWGSRLKVEIKMSGVLRIRLEERT